VSVHTGVMAMQACYAGHETGDVATLLLLAAGLCATSTRLRQRVEGP